MNQDQRELLELAAYAIGLKGGFGEKFSIGVSEVDCTDLFFVDDDSHCAVWNPLINKADAFDLMVKLHLNVESVYAGARCGTADKTIEVVNQDTTDHESAYMLAITRAAAAIGKQMKEQVK